MPQCGSPKPLKNSSFSGLRFTAVQGFEDILIFYIVEPEALRIIRVLHGKRDIKKLLERETNGETPN